MDTSERRGHSDLALQENSLRSSLKLKVGSRKYFKEITSQISKKSQEEIALFAGTKPFTKKPLHSDNLLEGNVEKPEICLQFLHKRCSEEFCKYFHCPKTYHWQLYFPPKSRWLNLSYHDSEHIELSFEDYKKEWTTFTSRTDGENGSKEKFFRDLFETSLVTVNFVDLTLRCVNERNQVSQQSYQLRRVSTPSTEVSSDMYATVWCWYFLFGETEWLPFGENYSPITSEDIEKQSNETSSVVLTFEEYNHEIDILTMKETIKESGIVRPIRKRPRPMDSKDKPKHTKATKTPFPSTWESMLDCEPHFLPQVADRKEIEVLQKRFIESLERHPKQMKFLRIQNKYLWEIYKTRKTVISKLLEKDESDVERIVYKSVKPDHLQYILLHNLGFNSQEKQRTKGIAFMTSAKHCEKEQQSGAKKKVIILVRLLVGAVTELRQNMSTMPMNSATMQQYDTAVDDVKHSTEFVKFTDTDYYPEYVIKYK